MGDQVLQIVNSNTPVTTGIAVSEELFRTHHERVFLAAYRISGNVQDAEDVLQSVFLKLLNQDRSDYVADNPVSYLCRAAINASLDVLRSRRRLQIVDLDEIEHEADQISPATDIDVLRSQQRRLLRAAITTLNAREAEVFTLRHFEDFGNADIAEVLGISTSSVAVTLHRAREKLQQQLRDLEGETP
jgi:RNA polymerase sigma-70 factor (ECF subfamily)